MLRVHPSFFSGVGLMIHSRGANASDAEIVWTQIIQSMGGGIAAVTSQVAAQASVPHVDVATATAVVLLLTEIGGAIGNAICTSTAFLNLAKRQADHINLCSWRNMDQHDAGQASSLPAIPFGDGESGHLFFHLSHYHSVSSWRSRQGGSHIRVRRCDEDHAHCGDCC